MFYTFTYIFINIIYPLGGRSIKSYIIMSGENYVVEVDDEVDGEFRDPESEDIAYEADDELSEVQDPSVDDIFREVEDSSVDDILMNINTSNEASLFSLNNLESNDIDSIHLDQKLIKPFSFIIVSFHSFVHLILFLILFSHLCDPPPKVVVLHLVDDLALPSFPKGTCSIYSSFSAKYRPIISQMYNHSNGG